MGADLGVVPASQLAGLRVQLLTEVEQIDPVEGVFDVRMRLRLSSHSGLHVRVYLLL